jgi:putative toxin-antitoxin system antitoxin component (TIGR02293 family)
MTTTRAPDTVGILAVLGGQKRTRHRVRTLLDLTNEVRAGLPKQALTSVLRAATRSAAEAVVARRMIIADATWKRRTVYLRPDESDRTLRLARVVAFARYVWDGRENDATAFLMATHPRLEGRTPLEACDTEIGARLVDDLLWPLFDGTVG